MCVKAYFNSSPFLGPGALVKDNWFYGNNTSEKIVDYQRRTHGIAYNVPLLWKSQFSGDGCEMEVFAILLQVAKQLNLTYLSEEALESTISHNIIGFDDIVKSFARNIGPAVTTHGKKRGQILRKVKNPSLPRRSPLLLNGEAELLHKLLSPFWDPLTEVKNNWVRWVITSGFSALSEHLRAIFNKRWNILTRYSNLTTKRLIELRKKSDVADNIRKGAVTQSVAARIPKERVNPVDEFLREILELIPKSELISAVGNLVGSTPTDQMSAEILLCTEISILYTKPDAPIIKEAFIPEKGANVSHIPAAEVKMVVSTCKALVGATAEAVVQLGNACSHSRTAAAQLKKFIHATSSINRMVDALKHWTILDLALRLVVISHPDIPVNRAEDIFMSFKKMTDRNFKTAEAQCDNIQTSMSGKATSTGESSRVVGEVNRFIGLWKEACDLIGKIIG
jgi:hypothetical protein